MPSIRPIFLFSAAAFALAACGPLPPSKSEPRARCRHRVIDVHSQVDFADFEEVIRSLNRSCVTAAFLSGRKGIKNRDIRSAARRWQGRILPMFKTKGGPWNEKSSEFFTRLSRALRGENFLAYGELLVLHQEKGNRQGDRWAPRIAYPPDDAWVLRAVDMIASRGFPIHYHLEAGLEPEVIPAFKRFLHKRPNVRIILGHRGWLDAGELGRLLRAHPNLYTHMGRTADQGLRESHFSGYGEVFEGGRLKAEWADLMNELPERFLYAQDNVWEFQWSLAPEAAELWRKNFHHLKAETVELFTHGNAERLFRIPEEARVRLPFLSGP